MFHNIIICYARAYTIVYNIRVLIVKHSFVFCIEISLVVDNNPGIFEWPSGGQESRTKDNQQKPIRGIFGNTFA